MEQGYNIIKRLFSRASSNMEFEYVRCNICNSAEYDAIVTATEEGSSINLVICRNCGLGYLNPRWKKERYQKYYQTDYDTQYRPQIISHSGHNEDGTPNIILERFKEAQLLPSDSFKILDIGSGEGSNLVAFKQKTKNAQLYAIEPSLNAHKLLRKNGIEIISTDVDGDWHKEYKDFFDIIIMRHVLEHFLDPASALNKMRTVLNDNGVAYIAVPNNLLKKRNPGWLRLAHAYYFNKYSLENITRKKDLNIISLHEGDRYNSLEIFIFVNKNKGKNNIQAIGEQFVDEQKNAFLIALGKK